MSRKLLAALACLVLGSAAAFAADPSQMSVTVREYKVRESPSMFGKIVGSLSYGDRVTLLEQPANAPKTWRKISMPAKGIQGWVNLSALTEKKIELKAGSQTAQQGASSGEVALANKGFNEEVEKQYRAEGKIDYTWVDRMATYNPSDDQVAAFLQKGGLNTTGGVQ
jgi:Bacterial SH3 domain